MDHQMDHQRHMDHQDEAERSSKLPQTQPSTTPISTEAVSYDHLVFGIVGEFGPAQWLIFGFVCINTVLGLDPAHMIFIGADMNHWCRLPPSSLVANMSIERQLYVSVPRAGPADTGPYSSCHLFDVNWTNVDDQQFDVWNRTERIAAGLQTVECSDWNYDQTIFQSTIIKRFNLVCDSEYLNRLISSLHMIGVFLGALTSGQISDRMGRRPAIVGFSLLALVSGVMSIWAPNYATFATARFMMGVARSGQQLALFVLLMELIGRQYRACVGIVVMLAWSFGLMLLPLIAYFVRDEFNFQLALIGPRVPLLLITPLLPESPRWLVVRGKYKKAVTVLRQMCLVNRRLTALPSDIEARLTTGMEKENKNKSPYNYIGLVQTPLMRMWILIMNLSWATCGLIYYALTLNVGTLSGDIFINTFISGAVEVPANLLCIFASGWRRMGRRLTGCLSLTGAGLFSFLCIPFVIQGYSVTATGLAMCGKLLITISYSVVYVHTTELFPTEFRNMAVSTASMSARLGSVLAPHMGTPLMRIWTPLPSLVFGLLTTLTGLAYLLLPETLGRPLPNTVQEAEKIAVGSGCAVRTANTLCLLRRVSPAEHDNDVINDQSRDRNINLVD